jgi:ankyrin repeat protein
VAAFLLDLLKPEDLRITDKSGDTPLHVLAGRTRDGKGRVHVGRRLVHADNGVAANIKNASGHLPLHLACSFHNEEVFTLLVDYTIDLDEENHSGKRALEVAVEMNLTGHVTQLLATGRVDIMKRNKKGQTIFSVAARNGNTSRAILELLYSASTSLAHLSDDTPDHLTPLHHALQSSGHHRAEKIKYLLSLPEADELVEPY